jgi:hypothetical protein
MLVDEVDLAIWARRHVPPLEAAPASVTGGGGTALPPHAGAPENAGDPYSAQTAGGEEEESTPAPTEAPAAIASSPAPSPATEAPPPAAVDGEWLSLVEAGDFCGCTYQAIADAARRAEIRHRKLGNKLQIHAGSLKHWKAQFEQRQRNRVRAQTDEPAARVGVNTPVRIRKVEGGAFPDPPPRPPDPPPAPYVCRPRRLVDAGDETEALPVNPMRIEAKERPTPAGHRGDRIGVQGPAPGPDRGRGGTRGMRATATIIQAKGHKRRWTAAERAKLRQLRSRGVRPRTSRGVWGGR